MSTETNAPAPTVPLAQLLADGFAGQAVADRARFELCTECDPAARRRLYALASVHSGVPTHRPAAIAALLDAVTCTREIGT